MYYSKRRQTLAQNFLTNRQLVKQLVRQSSLGLNDVVLEIGPGRGIITVVLLSHVKKVIAIELDPQLFSYAKNIMGAESRLELHHADALNFVLPNYPYKVFANVPFYIEGKIVRKLLNNSNPPTDTYLVVMDKFARRLSGLPRDNLFSLQHKPWFQFSIEHKFNRTDFQPVPSVDALYGVSKNAINLFFPFNTKNTGTNLSSKGLVKA